MIGAGIFEGDYVVVRQQHTARDGDIVVAIIEGQGTLKRLRYSKGKVSLVAENPHYRPIQVQTEAAMLQGVVFALLRRYGNGQGSRWHSRTVARAEAAPRGAGRFGKGRS
jgi:SOS-response transcriptional repressor LexA